MEAINDPIFDFNSETIHISPSGDMASYSHQFDMTFTSQGGSEKLEGFRSTLCFSKEGVKLETRTISLVNRS